MKKHAIMPALAALIAVGACSGNKVCSDGDVRISWDADSYSEITSMNVSNLGYVEKDLYYPRAKRLSDGAILLSYSNHHYGFDIYASRSEDNGATWSDAFCIAHSYDTTCVTSEGKTVPDRIVYVNPDFTELQDGRIIMAFQWRYFKGYGDLPKTNENCGIMVSFSQDKGRTWDTPREVYRGRCWEPAFLQLPSGEIHMYITSSQDIKDKTSYPRTMVIRSFDGGATWQGKPCCGIDDNEVVSRTIDERFAYDGMPTGILLDDGRGIAVPLESWHGRIVVDQTPIIVKTTMEENWHLDQKKVLEEGGPDYPAKKEVNKDLQGYGPYGTKLPTGEAVVLCNGTYKGVQGIWVLVGDKDADNFHHATAAFTSSEYWGNIDYIGDNHVIATGTYKYKDEEGTGRAMLHLIHGRLNYSKTVSGSLEMPSVGAFDANCNDWWFLGKNFNSKVFYNFGYTKDAFEIGAIIYDTKISSFTPENSDAAAVLFNRDGQTYEVVVNAVGNYTLYREEGYSWHVIDKGVTDAIEVIGTVNDDSDTDLGYSAKVSIPWSLIGGKPHAGEVMKAHPRRFYHDVSKEKPLAKVEDLEGENSDYPCEWLSVKLK